MPSRVRSVSWPDAVLASVLTALTLLAWRAQSVSGHQAHLAHHGLSLFFVGSWVVMTVAMMLPSVIPLLVLFGRIIGGRATTPWLLALVIAGYLAVWMAAGIVVGVFSGVLSLRFAAPAILAIAGLFQFSTLKHACLDKCRTPFSFIAERWRGGSESLQSLRIGIEHGIFCVGCCWALMLLMFIAGAGSLGLMLALGTIMAVEKNFSWGRRISAPLGVLLLVGAAFAAIGT